MIQYGADMKNVWLCTVDCRSVIGEYVVVVITYIAIDYRLLVPLNGNSIMQVFTT